MAWEYCSSWAIIYKAGKNANSDAVASGALLSMYHDQAMSYVNCRMRINLTDAYASLDADKKKIIEQVTSDLGAMYLIAYDMANYTNVYEGQTMLDLLRDNAERGLKLIEEKEVTDFIQ